METEQVIELGDFITDQIGAVVGPVIGEAVYPLTTRPGVPCWIIPNAYGQELWIWKDAAKLVRKADG